MKSVNYKLQDSMDISATNSLCSSNQVGAMSLLCVDNVLKMQLDMLITLQDDIVWVLSEVLR